MSEALEQRVTELEKKVAELSNRASTAARVKDPWRTFGIFADDPEFEEAIRLGLEYRREQTCDKEVAAS